MQRRDAVLALVALGIAAAPCRLAAQSERPDPARIAILDDASEATRHQLVGRLSQPPGANSGTSKVGTC